MATLLMVVLSVGFVLFGLIAAAKILVVIFRGAIRWALPLMLFSGLVLVLMIAAA